MVNSFYNLMVPAILLSLYKSCELEDEFLESLIGHLIMRFIAELNMFL